MAFFPRIGGQGINLNLQNQPTNLVTLQPAEVFTLPAGEFLVAAGPYTTIQWLDPVSLRWISMAAEGTLKPHAINSDGGNFRIANLTGCAVGANITAAGNGTGLTNGIGTAATGLTITTSAGGSTWVPVVGGAVNPTITISAGGTNYTYPPIVEFAAPPVGGIQASGYALLTSTTVSSIVTTNQGAGYTAAPLVTIINDQRDTTGAGASVTVNATLMGNTQLTALYPSNPGTTAVVSVPTFTFSPTSAITATMVMNFTVTGITASGVGAQTTFTGTPLGICYAPPVVPNAARVTAGIAGPIMDVNLTQARPGFIGITTNSNALTTTCVIYDAGFGFQTVPTCYVVAAGLSVAPTAGVATLTVGGTVDTSYVQPL